MSGPPARRTSARTRACRSGTPTRRASRRPARGPRWRRTGSSRGPLARSRWCSSQVLLVGPLGPLREQLAVEALLVELARHALDVVGELLGRNAQPAQRLPEPAGQAEAATQVHLVAVLAARQRTLEADVCGLDASARVGAAVEV